MLKMENTVLLLVDIQGKLAHLMHEKERLFDNLQKLIKGIRVLGIPVLWVEQNPVGLGPTIPEVADSLPDVTPISKMSFSSCRNDRFLQALKNMDRNQILIAGIETHICVYEPEDVHRVAYKAPERHNDSASSRVREGDGDRCTVRHPERRGNVGGYRPERRGPRGGKVKHHRGHKPEPRRPKAPRVVLHHAPLSLRPRILKTVGHVSRRRQPQGVHRLT